MRLSAEDLRQIKDLFNESVDEMLSKKEFCDRIAKIINNEVEALRVHADKLENENRKLREKIDDLEQYTRRSSLRIHGIPEESSENVEHKLINIFRDKLNINIPSECIDRCHRVGPIQVGSETTKKSVRPVIIKFTSYKFRESVYRSKSKLKGTRLVVSEDLTASKYALLKLARAKFGNNRAWSYDGKIFVMYKGIKAIVKSRAELDDMEAPLLEIRGGNSFGLG